MAGDLKAKVSFFADTKGLEKGIKRVETRFDKLGRGLERHSRKFMLAGGAMAGALAGLAAQGIAYGTTIDRMAESTGQAHEEMSRLAYSAELYHGSAEKVEKGVRSLAQKMLYAKDGLVTYRREFERAGIDVDAWGDKMPPVNDMLLELADSFATNADATEVLAGATVLLGGRQSALIPWMKQGSATIREQFKEASRLGQVLDAKTSKALERLGTEMKNVRLMARGIGVDVALAAAPAIEGLTGNIRELVAEFKSWTPEARSATVEMTALGAGTLGVLGYLGLIAPALGGVAIAAAPLVIVLAAIGAGWIGVNKALERAHELLKDTDPAIQAHGKTVGKWAVAIKSSAFGLAGIVWGLRNANKELEIFNELRIGGGGGGGGGAGAGGPEDEPVTPLAVLDNIPTPGPVDETAAAWRRYYDALSSGFTKLEIASLLLGEVDLGLANIGPAAEMSTLPIVELGEQIGALSDPLLTFADEFLVFCAEWAPAALAQLGSAVDTTFSVVELSNLKLWKSLKKAWAQGLKAVFNMFLDEKFAELAATLFTEQGKIVMSSFMNPLNLLKLAGLTAAYGTAKAALSGINSFDESAVVTRGGSLSGNVTVGDVIVSPDALKNFMKGGGGGRSVQVNVTFAGSYVGDSAGFRDDIDYLAERVALQMER